MGYENIDGKLKIGNLKSDIETDFFRNFMLLLACIEADSIPSDSQGVGYGCPTGSSFSACSAFQSTQT